MDAPPRLDGERTPISGYSSLSISRAPPMVSSAWPIRPSSPTTRKPSIAPKASRYQSMAAAAPCTVR